MTGRQKKNEYHGETPPYSLVETGTVETLRQIMPRSSSLCKTFALVIAYPPPDSEMAFHAVKTFLELGGTHFIYIGEFQGLTGTSRLERYLTRHARKASPSIACPTWGTDCSSVTFWVLTKEPQTTAQSCLLPCDNCSLKPATKRLRILRHLCYCSVKCWDAHKQSDEFAGHLQCSSLQIDMDTFWFDNDDHFLKLSR